MSTSGAYIRALARATVEEMAMYRCVGRMIAVRLHSVRGELHVMEHSFEFYGELEATLNFELGEHATLCVVRYRSVVKEALRKVSLIITFKGVLFGDEP